MAKYSTNNLFVEDEFGAVAHCMTSQFADKVAKALNDQYAASFGRLKNDMLEQQGKFIENQFEADRL